MSDLDFVIKAFEMSVKKRGDIALTTEHFLNILKMSKRMKIHYENQKIEEERKVYEDFCRDNLKFED